jgi:hypothetical protein
MEFAEENFYLNSFFHAIQHGFKYNYLKVDLAPLTLVKHWLKADGFRQQIYDNKTAVAYEILKNLKKC